MHPKHLSKVLLFVSVVLWNVLLHSEIEAKLLQINCFSYETALTFFREGSISKETEQGFWQAAGTDVEAYSELLTMYYATENQVQDVAMLQDDISFVKKYRRDEFERIKAYVQAVWEDVNYFPVGAIANNKDAVVTFENSWMQSRTFGGDRGHEGCDIMPSVNQRGIYPIYSMTDGVVENIGWLRLGGYRIGIRSESGAYFYYAHLAEYAKEFQEGEEIPAGTLLGFMGDTGYSDVPGTTGKFPVHLHMGIYLNDENGEEFSINSYPILRYIYEKRGLTNHATKT